MMQKFGSQLLARATLARDKYGDVGQGRFVYLVVNAMKRRGITYKGLLWQATIICHIFGPQQIAHSHVNHQI
jgi:hypothetical protein